MRPFTALVVDDEPQIRRLVRGALVRLHGGGGARGAGPPARVSPSTAASPARVVEAATGREGLDHAAAERPSLVVLDLGLPDMDGQAVCRELRTWSDAAVLVLSARHSDAEKAALLDAGADDYLTKPFSLVEFRARVRALLRRAARGAIAGDGAQGGTRLTAGALVVDFEARTVQRDGAVVHLTPIEWELLRTLAAHADRTMTHRQLFATVWPGRAYGDAQAYLRVHVAHLRRKLEADPVRPRHLRTEAGVGYRWVP